MNKHKGTPPQSRSWWNVPLYRYGLLTLGLSLALAATLLYFGYPPDWIAAWLIAVNLVTLATYAYDKAIANSGWMRVPEKVLLMLALIGGTPAALIGMWRFRHKTSKGSFLARLGLVALIQIALIAGYYLFFKEWIGG